MKRYIKTDYEHKDYEDYLSELDEYERQVLDHIYDNICKKWYTYGEYIESNNKAVGDYIFWWVLSCDGSYIHWRNYGSSAIKNSKSELAWLLVKVFEMTPSEFVDKYICVDINNKEVD